MPDREIVIKILSHFPTSTFCAEGGEVTVADVLALLKAQEPVRPGIGIIHNDDGSKSYFLHCPLDGTTLDEGDKYCRKCGRSVKWE